MTDLINKSIEEINALIQKYRELLEISDIRNHNDIPILAIIFDIGINHINTNYNDTPKDWKAWSMVVVRKMYYGGEIKYVENILNIINEFINFWKSNYKSYSNDTISVSDYDKNLSFIYKFISNKKSGK